MGFQTRFFAPVKNGLIDIHEYRRANFFEMNVGGSTAAWQDVDSQAVLTSCTVPVLFPCNTGYPPSASSDAEVSNHKPDNYLHCFGFSIILVKGNHSQL